MKKPNYIPPRIILSSPSIYNEYYDNSHDRYNVHPDCIFVFGSNLAGIHGKGAALTARRQYGAKLGHGVGFTGRAYAIPTKDEYLEVLPIEFIEPYIRRFVKLTQEGKHRFFVTAVGCGLAGYHPSQIAPLFRGVQYCYLPYTWLPYLL